MGDGLLFLLGERLSEEARSGAGTLSLCIQGRSLFSTLRQLNAISQHQQSQGFVELVLRTRHQL